MRSRASGVVLAALGTGLAVSLLAVVVYVTLLGQTKTSSDLTRSWPVGTVDIVWTVDIDPSTGQGAWHRADVGTDGGVQRTAYLSPAEYPAPPDSYLLPVAIAAFALGAVLGAGA